jgi:four helix bundle protein
MPRGEPRVPKSPVPNTSTSTLTQHRAYSAGRFDYQRLDAYAVAKEALGRGDRVARRLPRGYGKLADQLRRALLSAYLGVAEAASREGADRAARFRCSRGEAAEAAAALEAVQLLGLAPAAEVGPIISLLGRLCAMLTRLAGYAK